MLEKFKSRKLWITLLSTIVSIAGALMALGGTAGTVCFIIGAVITPIIYVLTEGSIDKKAVTLTVEAIEAILEELENNKINQETECK